MPHPRLAHMALIALALLAALLPQRSPARSQDVFHLLKDMNPTPQADTNDVGDMVTQGDFVYFLKGDGARSTQLWRIDAKAHATLIVDMAKSFYSYVGQLIATDDKVYFLATTAATGTELWVSNGTAAGTHIVADLTSGTESSFNPTSEFIYASKGKELYFTILPASDNANTALLRTDGTPEGTLLISNRITKPIYGMRVIGSTIYMVIGSKDDYSASFWVSDGTYMGTKPLVDIERFPSDEYDINDMLFDIHGKMVAAITNTYQQTIDIWQSDGTTAGTSIITKIPSTYTYDTTLATEANGRLYFFVPSDTNTPQLWQTDGTAVGTALVTQFSNSQVSRLFVANNKVLFTRYDYDTYTYALWASDGTIAGTSLITEDINTDNPTTHAIGSHTLICTDAILSTDGTADGTTTLSNTNDAEWCVGSVELGGKLIARASKAASGKPLWSTDGTKAGTGVFYIPQDIAGSSVTQNAIQLGSTTYLVTQNHLWKTDGTEAGTVEQTAIDSVLPQDAAIGPLLSLKNDLIIQTSQDNGYSTTLWRSDGTPAGTSMFASGIVLGESAPISTTNGTLFFASRGSELWKSDGSRAGTKLITSKMGAISKIVGSDKLVFIMAQDSGRYNLWKSDGTDAGTTKIYIGVKPIVGPIFIGKNIYWLGPISNRAEFCKYDEASISPTCYPDLIAEQTIQSASLQIFHNQPLISLDLATGTQLWQSDGTQQSTRKLLSLPKLITPIAISSQLYFFTGTNDGGSTLWRSTGLSTTAIREFSATDTGFSPSLVSIQAGALYFTAYTPDHGTELWRSNGTAEGTTLYADINPGPASSTPSLLLAQGESMLVQASTAAYGSEPYVIDTPAVAPTPDETSYLYLPLAQH